LFPHRTFLGRPLCEGTSEAEALGVVASFDHVYHTGEPFYAHEMEGWFDFQGNGEPEQVFLNIPLHPLRNAQYEVDGVLDFSYNVTGQVGARRQLEQLNQDLETRAQALTQEAEDLLPMVRDVGAKLVIDVAALPPIHFSEKNLRSVVYNLLSNAVKYHSPDRPPRVDVRARVYAGHTLLEVHDNGLGMASSQLPKLFGMFQRFHDHVNGSGIGLSMVKRMVENAGGRIEVHSQLGAGTTFFVYLPQAAPAA
jgi:signal transduction histidine kinase